LKSADVCESRRLRCRPLRACCTGAAWWAGGYCSWWEARALAAVRSRLPSISTSQACLRLMEVEGRNWVVGRVARWDASRTRRRDWRVELQDRCDCISWRNTQSCKLCGLFAIVPQQFAALDKLDSVYLCPLRHREYPSARSRSRRRGNVRHQT